MLSIQRPFKGITTILLCTFLSACNIELSQKVDEAQANEMMAILLNEGIPTEKTYDKEGLVTLSIDESDFSKAVPLLKSHGFPKAEFSDMGVVFKQDSMISTPTEEWARFLYARSQELSQSITDIEGVMLARVHIAIPKKGSLLEKTPPPSASVLARVNADVIDDKLLPKIKKLVTFSVEELDYENVSVVLTPVTIDQVKPNLVSIYGLIVHEKSTEKIQYFFFGMLALVIITPAALYGVWKLAESRAVK